MSESKKVDVGKDAPERVSLQAPEAGDTAGQVDHGQESEPHRREREALAKNPPTLIPAQQLPENQDKSVRPA